MGGVVHGCAQCSVCGVAVRYIPGMVALRVLHGVELCTRGPLGAEGRRYGAQLYIGRACWEQARAIGDGRSGEWPCGSRVLVGGAESCMGWPSRHGWLVGALLGLLLVVGRGCWACWTGARGVALWWRGGPALCGLVA